MCATITLGCKCAGFGVEINQVPVVDMSNELSMWLLDVHSMLGQPAHGGHSLGSNPSLERNNNNNSGSNHTTNDDNFMMAQIL